MNHFDFWHADRNVKKEETATDFFIDMVCQAWACSNKSNIFWLYSKAFIKICHQLLMIICRSISNDMSSNKSKFLILDRQYFTKEFIDRVDLCHAEKYPRKYKIALALFPQGVVRFAQEYLNSPKMKYVKCCRKFCD